VEVQGLSVELIARGMHAKVELPTNEKRRIVLTSLLLNVNEKMAIISLHKMTTLS
jgi:hypothetical protein